VSAAKLFSVSKKRQDDTLQLLFWLRLPLGPYLYHPSLSFRTSSDDVFALAVARAFAPNTDLDRRVSLDIRAWRFPTF
jgi:hypothetical protein